jgi:hypothetical protein
MRTNWVKGLVGMGVLLAAIGCSSDSGNPFIDDCVEKNTSQVSFKNTSSNHYYDIVWDGGRIVSSLAPGQTSENFTVNAGDHVLQFKFSGSNNQACSTAYPDLVQCNSVTWSCGG